MVGVAGSALAAGAGMAASGCSGSTRPAPAAFGYAGEARMIALVVALENQLAWLYRAALASPRLGPIGASAPAFASLARTCLAQHVEHARAWNAILHALGKPILSGAPLSGQPALVTAIRSADTVPAIAGLALGCEHQIAQTYVAAIGQLTSTAGLATAASVAPVEAMHATLLRFMLGENPVPSAFAGTAGAAGPGDLNR
jgi:hypothetical protein